MNKISGCLVKHPAFKFTHRNLFILKFNWKIYFSTCRGKLYVSLSIGCWITYLKYYWWKKHILVTSFNKSHKLKGDKKKNLNITSYFLLSGLKSIEKLFGVKDLVLLGKVESGTNKIWYFYLKFVSNVTKNCQPFKTIVNMDASGATYVPRQKT